MKIVKAIKVKKPGGNYFEKKTSVNYGGFIIITWLGGVWK